MSIRINLNGESASYERVVSGPFGEFYITMRRPLLTERIRARALLYEEKLEDLFSLRLSLVSGWRDLVDMDGKPIPCNDHTKAMVFANQSILDAVLGTVASFLEESPTLGDDDKKKLSEQPETTASQAGDRANL